MKKRLIKYLKFLDRNTPIIYTCIILLILNGMQSTQNMVITFVVSIILFFLYCAIVGYIEGLYFAKKSVINISPIDTLIGNYITSSPGAYNVFSNLKGQKNRILKENRKDFEFKPFSGIKLKIRIDVAMLVKSDKSGFLTGSKLKLRILNQEGLELYTLPIAGKFHNLRHPHKEILQLEYRPILDESIKVECIADDDASYVISVFYNELYLKRGEDNRLDMDLLFSILQSNRDEVSSYLKSGADPNASDLKGRTALSLAKENQDHEIVKLLTEAGARE